MEASHEELDRRYHDREKANAGGGCPLAVENAVQWLGKGHGGGLCSAPLPVPLVALPLGFLRPALKVFGGGLVRIGRGSGDRRLQRGRVGRE